MRQTGAEMVALMGHENLGFLLQAAEGRSVDDSIPVPRKGRAKGFMWFRNGAAQRLAGVTRKAGQSIGHGLPH